MYTPLFWPARPTRVWATSALYLSLVQNEAWAVEPKLDGFRVLVWWRAGGVEAWTRHGKPQRLTPRVRAVLEGAAVGEGTIVDGELLGPRRGEEQDFVGFDVPCLCGELAARLAALDERRSWLKGMRLPMVPWLPNKPGSFERALNLGHEGLVLKKREMGYPYAMGPNAPETAHWFKVKAPTQYGRLIS